MLSLPILELERERELHAVADRREDGPAWARTACLHAPCCCRAVPEAGRDYAFMNTVGECMSTVRYGNSKTYLTRLSILDY